MKLVEMPFGRGFLTSVILYKKRNGIGAIFSLHEKTEDGFLKRCWVEGTDALRPELEWLVQEEMYHLPKSLAD